jgi:3-hydroxyacyl-CoA dehydrogenase
MGPFRLMDLTRIDLNYIMSLERFKKPATGPTSPPQRGGKVPEGRYGEKDRQGW